jgi:hypothetical protein
MPGIPTPVRPAAIRPTRAPAPRAPRPTLDQRRAAEFVAKGDQLRARGRPRLAAECYRQAIAYDRARAAAVSGLGQALWEMGRHAEAIERLEEAVALDPAAAAPARALADAYSLSGQSMPAIKYYRQAAATPRRRFAAPAWDGAPLRGRRLLVHATGSMGAQLAMARLLPAVARLDGPAVVECHPALVRRRGAAAGTGQVVAAGDPLPAFDVHASLASLPRLLGERAAAPATRAALPLPAGEPPAAARAIEQTRGVLRIGLAWAGEDTAGSGGSDEGEVLPLSALLTLLRAPGARFFSLQRGAAARARAELPADHQPLLTDSAAGATDLLDVARVVAPLDLVIAVDGAIAQVAAALGQPVWLVLPARAGSAPRRAPRPEGAGGAATRLFRQQAVGDWDTVAAELRAAVAELAGRR